MSASTVNDSLPQVATKIKHDFVIAVAGLPLPTWITERSEEDDGVDESHTLPVTTDFDMIARYDNHAEATGVLNLLSQQFPDAWLKIEELEPVAAPLDAQQ